MFKYARTRSYNGEGLSAELKTVGRADTPAVVLLGTSTQDFVGEESFVNQQTANEHLSTERVAHPIFLCLMLFFSHVALF